MRGYQLKITVKGSKPPIWRRILVPDKISFHDLDDIIEEAFGWTHSHLFSFYFREADEYFQGGFMGESEDTAALSVEGWLWEGCTFLYTYDFGDSWEHTVTVERVFPYDRRYPQVVKSKGPNMIEDCGGIGGFYECADQAELFDMEAVNAKFRMWNMAETADGEGYEEEEGWSILDDLDDLEDVWDVDVLEDGEFADGMESEKAFEEKDFLGDLGDRDIDPDGISGFSEESGEVDDDFPEDEDTEELRRQFARPPRLLDIYTHYKKGELEMVARANGFARHGSMRKAELASWLCSQLLSEPFFEDCISRASREEIELFEDAMDEDGIRLSEDLVSTSLMFCTYGAFLGEYDFYRVPVDVEARYREITTPEFLRKREMRWTMRACCDAAVYLYGVLPVVKLAEIWGQYGDSAFDEKGWTDFIHGQIQDGVPYALEDGYLMDSMLLESNMYRHILKVQERCDYYIPENREEFLRYGELECQEPDENTQFFLDYLQKKCRLNDARSLVAFYTVQEALRRNSGEEGALLALKKCGCTLESEKSRREALRQIHLLEWHVRHWDLKGHTPWEIQGGDGKIVPIFGNTVRKEEKKAYPNDPCPCGSGKKYKHCCGRK